MLKVLFAASEAAPFIKTGGLGDVIGSLPKALKRENVDVRVVMPKYQEIPPAVQEKIKWQESIYVPVGWRNQFCGLEYMVYEGIPFYFLDNKYYYNRPGYYGYPDDGERYAFFSRAVLEMLPFFDFQPDVIHCHDWQTGMVPALHKIIYQQKPYYRNMKTMFTIHNLRYQGIFPPEVLRELFNLGSEHLTREGLEFHGNVSYMKGGINYADLVTTVSPTYAQEIQTPYYGEQLDGLLRSHAQKLRGVLNGLDYEDYNPATDPLIPQTFSVADSEKKMANKKWLQEHLGLPLKQVPLIAMITRLVPQKGLDLVQHVLDEIMDMDVQLAIIGTGDHQYEQMLQHAAHRHPDKCSVQLKFDNHLARQLYAASDLFLMPSQFEPCGLGQLIALRYGSLPVVRETGGLKDTVLHYQHPSGDGNGFTFANYNAHEMLASLQEAVTLYQNDPPAWQQLVKHAMACDFSWDQSANTYKELYEVMTLKNRSPLL